MKNEYMASKRALTSEEINLVNGAIAANIAGAVAGAVGGFFGAIIGGNQNTSGWTIASATVGGALAGGLNPIRGFAGAISSIGGGVAAGGASNVISDIEAVAAKKN